MRGPHINRISGAALIVLSLTALVTVITGLISPAAVREPDEGTQAHVFQLSIVGLLPMTVVVIGTADWRQPWRSAAPLAIAFVATLLAFEGLWYLEHLR